MLKNVICQNCGKDTFYIKSLDGSRVIDAVPICIHCGFDALNYCKEEESEKLLQKERSIAEETERQRMGI